MRKNAPRLIGDVLKDVVEGLSQAKKKEIFKIIAAWPSLLGKDFSRHTKPVSLQRGTLVVNVDESAWLYQANLQKEKLLVRLQKKTGGQKVQSIRFRIGKVR